MRGLGWLLGLLLLWIVAEGFLFKLHDAGVLDALERWRERPRAVVIMAIELALLLTVSGFSVTTSGWAAVAWAGRGVAGRNAEAQPQGDRLGVAHQAGSAPLAGREVPASRHWSHSWLHVACGTNASRLRHAVARQARGSRPRV